jgi:hypothetical protein
LPGSLCRTLLYLIISLGAAVIFVNLLHILLVA